MKSSKHPATAGFATRAIHAGYAPEDAHGALTPPIYPSSTYAFPSAAAGMEIFAGEREGYIYSRVGNPTTGLLETRLASLEGGEAALATGSGMGAIASLFWTLLRPGDEIIADETLYGCTFALLNHGLSPFGVKVRHVNLSDPDSLAAALSAATRLVYFETPANPNMRLVDIAAVAEIAHAGGARVVVDNTYCTPYLQRPLEFGADFVVHSATKYLGGHGDLIAGAIVGPAEDLKRIRFFGLKEMTGAVLSAFDAFLVLRGLKTLNLRMDRHCANALTLARHLAQHPAVATVAYPGLEDFPQHALARRQMADFGGMIALELKGGLAQGMRFMDALELATRAVSLGDAETLVQHPASMTHSTYAPEERAAHGISDTQVRISVGLEDIADLIADFDQALDRSQR
ncbi:MAG: methionine gamma-lyase [Thiotrichales bacterium]